MSLRIPFPAGFHKVHRRFYLPTRFLIRVSQMIHPMSIFVAECALHQVTYNRNHLHFQLMGGRRRNPYLLIRLARTGERRRRPGCHVCFVLHRRCILHEGISDSVCLPTDSRMYLRLRLLACMPHEFITDYSQFCLFACKFQKKTFRRFSLLAHIFMSVSQIQLACLFACLLVYLHAYLLDCLLAFSRM